MKNSLYIFGLVLLALVGCSTETPTQAPGADTDVVAEIVAGAVGYQSNGLTATVGDVIAAGKGRGLRDMVRTATAGDVIVTQTDSSYDPGSRNQKLSFVCQRSQADDYSEWKLRYQIGFAEQAPGASALGLPLNAQAHTDGTYRSPALTVQGSSTTDLQFENLDARDGANLSGDYQWVGTTVVRSARDERYTDVSVRISWNRLSATADPRDGRSVLNGRCDINIRANGPSGVISKNGILTFDGGDTATLVIGGKRYLVSLGTARLQQEG
ncbi:MAG: hypothetical protein ABIR47_13155 [Candidatus Kapaibacterium sp.]